VGFNSLDRGACAQSVFNSVNLGAPPLPPTVTELLGNVLSGSANGRALVQNFFIPGTGTFPTVGLNADVNDGPGGGILAANSMSRVLTD
jgi:hypothetical protein